MKKQTLVLALLGLASSQSFAQMNNEEWARVKSSEPIYGQAAAIPQQHCTTQMVERTVMPAEPQPQTNYAGAALGGIIGAIGGNQIGGGSGRALATAIGAGVGALTGERMIGVPQGGPQVSPLYGQTQMVPVQNCQVVTRMEAPPIVGYRVVLDHHGRDIVFQTPNAPRGEFVKIRVQVTPEF